MLTFSALSWHSADREEEEDVSRCVVYVFGRTLDGRSVCVHLPWTPWFFLEVSPLSSEQTKLMHKFPRRNRPLSVIVKRTPIYGFCNGAQHTFARLAFDSEAAWRSGMWVARKKLALTVWEGAVTPLAQCMHAAGVKPASWLTVRKGQSMGRGCRLSRCDVEVAVADYRDLVQTADPPLAPVPWVLASWDLETYSPNGSFPKASFKECPIIQIGVTIAQFQGPPDSTRRHVITTTPCNAVAGVDIAACDGECAAILAFADLLNSHQVDVLIAWNGSGFDNKYLYDRAVLHDIDLDLCISKLKGTHLILQSSKEPPYYFDLPGVLQYDPMLHLRQQNRFDSYKLDSVAREVTGQSKVDLPYDEIFRLHREGGPAGQATVARYCSVDCELPLTIIQRLALVPAILALSNATRTPANAILTRGQVSDRAATSPHQCRTLV